MEDSWNDKESKKKKLCKRIKALKLQESIDKFNKLNLRLDRSPSDSYFRKVFQKLYGDFCLGITNELLNKIIRLNNDDQVDLISIDQNTKIFLYAYVIVINHHDIFGQNSKIEKTLVAASLDMLYVFIKLCERIHHLKLTRLETLLKKFMNKYKIFYRHLLKWQNEDAKNLLNVLTLSYYNLLHNLPSSNKRKIGKGGGGGGDGGDIDQKMEVKINRELDQIENRIQYLILDNTPSKIHVIRYLNQHQKKIGEISKKVEKHYWDILIYNLENRINVVENLLKIFKMIKKRIQHLSHKYGIEYKKDLIERYLEYIKGKELDFELFTNKHFLHLAYYFIEVQEELENARLNKKRNTFNQEVKEKICHEKYKAFAKKFIQSDYNVSVPKFLDSVLEGLDKFR